MSIRLTPADVAVAIASCDERLQLIQTRKTEKEQWATAMASEEFVFHLLPKGILSGEVSSDELQRLKTFQHNNHRKVVILNFETKLTQIEKQIYTALGKTKNAPLYPLFLSKIDEILTALYEVVEGEVRDGAREEGEYLEFCKASLEQRNYIKDLCWAGEFQGRVDF